jgi:hypothetical protein
MILMKDCVVGTIYAVRARNFQKALYIGAGQFVGIRKKFGETYLATEQHREIGGTVGAEVALALVNEKVMTQALEEMAISSPSLLMEQLKVLDEPQ